MVGEVGVNTYADGYTDIAVLETEVEAMCASGANMEGGAWAVICGNAGDGSANRSNICLLRLHL